MLQQVCEYIHNFFISAPHVGTWKIEGGTIALDFLKEGQRFWITGSDLNDAVYTWHQAGIKDDDDGKAVTLADEEFSGTICAMAIPKSVLEIAAEIKAWNAKYGDTVSSPYQSETFNGYSYTKAAKNGQNANGSPDWQGIFAKRLNVWRKVSLP